MRSFEISEAELEHRHDARELILLDKSRRESREMEDMRRARDRAEASWQEAEIAYGKCRTRISLVETTCDARIREEVYECKESLASERTRSSEVESEIVHEHESWSKDV